MTMNTAAAEGKLRQDLQDAIPGTLHTSIRKRQLQCKWLLPNKKLNRVQLNTTLQCKLPVLEQTSLNTKEPSTATRTLC